MFRRLVEGAEVVVESFPPGYLTELGLGYESLASIKPRLVMTSVTPFGQDGPYAGYRATNLTAFAAGGQMAVTGEPDREPLKSGGHHAEYQAGLHAFAATAVAAFSADATEVGQHIDIAAMECLATMLEPHVSSWAHRSETSHAASATPTPARDGPGPAGGAAARGPRLLRGDRPPGRRPPDVSRPALPAGSDALAGGSRARCWASTTRRSTAASWD